MEEIDLGNLFLDRIEMKNLKEAPKLDPHSKWIH